MSRKVCKREADAPRRNRQSLKRYTGVTPLVSNDRGSPAPLARSEPVCAFGSYPSEP